MVEEGQVRIVRHLSFISITCSCIIIASMVAASPVAANTIDMGGGPEQWHYGYNYTDWAIKHGPFYQGDILVFKYDPPSANTSAHNVFLFPDLWSYIRCDFSHAKLLASETQGTGYGFQYKLANLWRPLFFASNGTSGDCKDGLMKFFVVPLPHWAG